MSEEQNKQVETPIQPNSIFNSTAQSQPAVVASEPAPQNPFADLLGTIKNERGEPKYRDIPTAIDALRNSQEFIPQLKTKNENLEQELITLRNEVQRLKTVEESIEKLTSQQNVQASLPASNGLTEEAVANLVTKTLTAREQQAVAQANLKQVVSKMEETYGQDAAKVFYSKAQEMGLSVEQINGLASQSPQAVLKLFNAGGSDVKSNPLTINKSSINTEAYQPQKESFLGRNTQPVILGATNQELIAEQGKAAQLVEELHNKGLDISKLTDPKEYFKYFK